MMTIEEIRDLLAETAKISQENSKGLKESNKKLDKLAEQSKASNERLDKMAEQSKISQEREEKKLKALQKLVGSMANSQADMIEEFIYNTIDYHHKKLFGIQFDEIDNNVKNRVGKKTREYDIVLYNGDSIGIVEIKSKAHVNDLDVFQDKIKDFRVLFPMYQNFKIYIGIASLHLNDEVIKACQAKGYGVIKLAGEKIEIVSDEVRAY